MGVCMYVRLVVPKYYRSLSANPASSWVIWGAEAGSNRFALILCSALNIFKGLKGPVGEQINQRRSPHRQRLEFGVPKEALAVAGRNFSQQRNPTTLRAVFLRGVGLELVNQNEDIF